MKSVNNITFLNLTIMKGEIIDRLEQKGIAESGVFDD